MVRGSWIALQIAWRGRKLNPATLRLKGPAPDAYFILPLYDPPRIGHASCGQPRNVDTHPLRVGANTRDS